jgi:glutamate-ammonia-ligase adenylyltransferase
MQARLATDMPSHGPFDLRATSGGMMEISFVAQALQLIHGATDPALFQPNTAAALAGLAAAGHLHESEAEALTRADFLWRTIQGINRITGLSTRATEPPAAMLEPLLRATGFETLAALHGEIADTAKAAHEIFSKLIIEGAAT